MLKRCPFAWLFYSCFLFGVLSALGIWSHCPNQALTVCLQQLLHDPRPKVHPVVPGAAAPDRGGEVGGHIDPHGGAAGLARGILLPLPGGPFIRPPCSRPLLCSRSSVFRGSWHRRENRIEGLRIRWHLFMFVPHTSHFFCLVFKILLYKMFVRIKCSPIWGSLVQCLSSFLPWPPSRPRVSLLLTGSRELSSGEKAQTHEELKSSGSQVLQDPPAGKIHGTKDGRRWGIHHESINIWAGLWGKDFSRRAGKEHSRQREEREQRAGGLTGLAFGRTVRTLYCGSFQNKD